MLWGTDSDDEIRGYSGADTLQGGAGNDTLNAGSGHDVVYAGLGNDVVYAGLGHDYVDCGDGNDFIDGGAGNDTIHGGCGNDTIYGGSGNDIITGSPQDSTRLLGRNEIDTVFGGDGSDTFSILRNAYLSGGDSNYMLIGDFDRSRDRLQLSKGSLYVLETIDNYTRVVMDGFDTVAIIPGLVLDKPAIVGKDTYNDFWINASFDWVTFV
jgi:Ca2+-binding RTX toxin-like protein